MPTKINESYFSMLGNSASVVQLCVDRAEAIAATARSTARVDQGYYRASIRVTVVQAAYRKVAKVIADSDNALVEETITGNLARAVRANSA